MEFVAVAVLGLVAVYLLLAYAVYVRAFVPARPFYLDDFTFTPYEFQADYEDVELATADGVAFGAWYFRQPGSPQTVIVSGGHKGQRPGATSGRSVRVARGTDAARSQRQQACRLQPAGGAQLARAAPAFLHPWRGRRHHAGQPQPASL